MGLFDSFKSGQYSTRNFDSTPYSRFNSPSYPRPRRRAVGRGFSPQVAFFALFAIVALTVAGFSVAQYFGESTYANCVVTDKDRTTNAEGGSEMRVYTENCGVLKVGDNLMKGNFSSADIYASIDEGGTYDFQATGSRIPFLSMFPIIFQVDEVTAAPAE